MKLPERVAAARERLGLTQAQLAKKLGISAGTVAGWETTGPHHHGISKKLLPKVSKILQLEITELLA